MKINGDDAEFWAVLDEIKERLERLNRDESFSGFASRFRRLLEEMPADFFECEMVPAISADELNPTLIIRSGPHLNALAVALRALDFPLDGHIEPLPLEVA